MVLVHPEPKLLDHLIVEFGDHGRRAVGFIRTAEQLLELAASHNAAARLPETIAYCLREAMKAIPASVDVGDGALWKDASRAVTEARRRYERARGMPGEDEQGALRELLTTIDDLDLVHAQEGIHKRRLIAIIVNRTGALPLAAGTEPIRTYQDLLAELDEAVHGTTTLDEFHQLWNRCMGMLRQLFLPPDIRHAELDEMASIEEPGSADVDRLLPLMAGPNHLRHFLRQGVSVAWLEALTETGILDPPTDGAWPVAGAVDRLAENDAEDFVGWLNRMYDRHAGDPRPLWLIGRVAVDIGTAGTPVVIRLLRDHPSSPGVSQLGVWAAKGLSPHSEHVESIADAVLNEASWRDAGSVKPVLQKLVDGLIDENASRRLQLLCWKLRAAGPDEESRQWFDHERSGSVADLDDERRPDRITMLLHTLVRAIQRSTSWVPTEEIIGIVDQLPDGLSARLRAWVLATAQEVDISRLIAEVARAIAEREPTGDDVALVDRVVAEAAPDQYVEPWLRQFGDPPTVGEAAEGLASKDLPADWVRAYCWAGVLPEQAIGAWFQPLSVIMAAYGRPTRDTLQKRPQLDFASGHSPMTSDELSTLPPTEAAEKIAAWRPDPSDWLVGARELGRTLEVVVKEKKQAWLESPLKVATGLRHPTYIDHYLRAVTDAIKDSDEIPTDDLLDVVALVYAHPWEAEPLGRDNFDYDPDWSGAEKSSVDVLKSLAAADVGFAGRNDAVWSILEAEVRDRTEPSGIVSGARDPLESAINRRCTRALDAVLSFAAYEYRTDERVRPEVLNLLEDALRLEGVDGTEHRAILATRLGFIRHIAPDWMDENTNLLLGSEAPDELARVTADLAIKWSRPNPWLLEHHRPLVRDAVLRDVTHALDHLLIAMLWDVPGYGIEDNLAFLLQSPASLSKAGEALGRLLRHDDAQHDHIRCAVTFWERAIATNVAEGLPGFGWMAEIEQLEDPEWAELTVRTLAVTDGQIDWSQKVAQRAAAVSPSTTTLSIMNHLIRGSSNEWERRDNIEHAVSLLTAASPLSGTPEYERLRTTLLERGAL